MQCPPQLPKTFVPPVAAGWKARVSKSNGVNDMEGWIGGNIGKDSGGGGGEELAGWRRRCIENRVCQIYGPCAFL